MIEEKVLKQKYFKFLIKESNHGMDVYSNVSRLPFYVFETHFMLMD